ncbi:MAG: hypothetical protein H7067_07725 [Burkholderiales bacterium]|nr:hypothetical protein [Opitutaceae bacterium]
MSLKLLACPICSHPPHLLARPVCMRGVRSERWMIVTEAGCPHMDIWRSDNSNETPEPLVAAWNTWAEAAAAQIATERGLSPEMAAKRLDALRPHSYLKR